MTTIAPNKLIAGAGGGGKAGGSGGATPTEAPNSLRSSQKATVIDALCEGPIAGLVNGAQSVFFDKTPLQNADGSYNFNNAIFGYTTGDLASNYSGMSQMASDGGAVEATTAVGVRVWQATPIVRNPRSNIRSTSRAMRVASSQPFRTASPARRRAAIRGPTLCR